MKRRKFLAMGAGTGLAAVLMAKTTTTLNASSVRTSDVSVIPDKTVQSRLTSISGDARLRHPKLLHAVELEPRALYDGTVIEFRTSGSVIFASGRKLEGLAGQKFKVKCFRDPQSGDVLSRSLLKAVTLDEIRSRIKDRHV